MKNEDSILKRTDSQSAGKKFKRLIGSENIFSHEISRNLTKEWKATRKMTITLRVFRAFSWLILPLLFLLIKFDAQAEEIQPVDAANIGMPNWSGQDYAPQISPEGRFLIFQSDRPGSHEQANLWFTVNRNFRDANGPSDWTIPLPLFFPMSGNPSETMQIVRPPGSIADPPGSFSVNSDAFEGMASLVYKNNKPVELYFTSTADPVRRGMDGLNIYFTRYRDERWSPPEHLNIINSDFADRMSCLSSDGRRMYFVSDRPGGYGANDIWYSERNMQTGRWAPPVNAGMSVNTSYNEISPGLPPGGEMLFFSSDRPGGFGHYDLYVSRRNVSVWERPENLGAPYNSPHDDESISITEDGLWSYFASDRRDSGAAGGFDIYRVTLPERLRSPVEVLFTGLVLDGSSRLPLGVEATIQISYEKGTIVSASSVITRRAADPGANNFAVGLLSGREYRAVFSAPGFHPAEVFLDYKGNARPDRIDRRLIVMQPIASTDVTEQKGRRILPGIVLDARTGLPLPGSHVTLQVRGEPAMAVRINDNARFRISVPDEAAFSVKGSAPSYRDASADFISGEMPAEIVLRLQPGPGEGPCPGLQVDCISNMKVFFPLDSAVLPPAELKKIELIVEILKKNTSLQIEISGHTDRTYTYEYNQRLSELRAGAVRDVLVKAGISQDRLLVKGYSFSHLAVQETTAEALNRRVEFRVVHR